MAGQPNTYSDGGLIRGSIKALIPDGGNTASNLNYILKDFKPDAPVRQAQEYDQSGLPFAGSYVRDFKAFSFTIAAITGTNAPAQMTKFAVAPFANNVTNVNYIITSLSSPQTTEGIVTWTGEAKEVIN